MLTCILAVTILTGQMICIKPEGNVCWYERPYSGECKPGVPAIDDPSRAFWEGLAAEAPDVLRKDAR